MKLLTELDKGFAFGGPSFVSPTHNGFVTNDGTPPDPEEPRSVTDYSNHPMAEPRAPRMKKGSGGEVKIKLKLSPDEVSALKNRVKKQNMTVEPDEDVEEHERESVQPKEKSKKALTLRKQFEYINLSEEPEDERLHKSQALLLELDKAGISRKTQPGQMGFEWDESEHPRHPAGSSQGGEFTKKEYKGGHGPFKEKHEHVPPKILGINDDVTTCEKCGKPNLKKTVVLEFEDGGISHYGSDCAAAALYGSKSSGNRAKVDLEAKAVEHALRRMKETGDPWKVTDEIQGQIGYGKVGPSRGGLDIGDIHIREDGTVGEPVGPVMTQDLLTRIQNMLRSGRYTDEQIAEMRGATLSQVRSISRSFKRTHEPLGGHMPSHVPVGPSAPVTETPAPTREFRMTKGVGMRLFLKGLTKKSKKEVDYGRGNAQRHCGNCRHFHTAGETCDLVKGHITAPMWCELWEPNEDAREEGTQRLQKTGSGSFAYANMSLQDDMKKMIYKEQDATGSVNPNSGPMHTTPPPAVGDKILVRHGGSVLHVRVMEVHPDGTFTVQLLEGAQRFESSPSQVTEQVGVKKAIKRRKDEAAQGSTPKGYPEDEDQYADPTNRKYPLDTPEHVHAAAGYIQHPHNRSFYSAEELKQMEARIRRAGKRHGVEVEEKSFNSSMY